MGLFFFFHQTVRVVLIDTILFGIYVGEAGVREMNVAIMATFHDNYSFMIRTFS